MGTNANAWWWLVASVVAEVVGTIALRHADGFTRMLPSLLVAVAYVGAIGLMSLAVRQLDVGLAYAVWAGAGTALTAAIGIAFFGESATLFRLLGLVLIVSGVVVLNLSAS